MSSSSNEINNKPREHGSPLATNPKQDNTIQKLKQSTKGVKFEKERRHAEQRVQLIQLLVPPPSHLDDLRVMPVTQLNELSDVSLVKQALQLVTNDDPHGYTRTENVSIPQLLTTFATSAKSRDQRPLTKLMKAHDASLKYIAKVHNYIRNDDIGDDIGDDKDSERYSDSSVEQLFPSFNKKMDGAASRAMKNFFALIRPVSTLALATVGVEQPRLPYKRKHQPTEFYGTCILEQRQHGNELLCPTEILPIKESSCAPATNVDPILIDLTVHVVNINNDVSVHDDFFKDVSPPNDIAAYDDNQSESFDDIEKVDDGVAGSVIFSDDSHLHAEFWGIRSNEFEACFDILPADNGFMYFEAGTIENEWYGPLPLTEIISPPAPVALALHSDDNNMLAQHEQQIQVQARLQLL